MHGNIGPGRTTQLAKDMKDIISKYLIDLEKEKKESKEKEQSKENRETLDIKKALGDRYNPPQQVVLLSQDRAVIVCANPRNPNENNKCIEAYYQLGKLIVGWRLVSIVVNTDYWLRMIFTMNLLKEMSAYWECLSQPRGHIPLNIISISPFP